MEQIDWTVRYAAQDDLARVNKLRAMVSALHAAGRPDIFRPGFCEALAAQAAQALDAPKEDIVVACTGAQVCGFALVQYVDRPESAYQHARRIYHIEEFGVDAAYRRRGAATAMIGFCRREAARLGFPGLELDVWSFNEDAQRFYESAGFRTYRSFLELPL